MCQYRKSTGACTYRLQMLSKPIFGWQETKLGYNFMAKTALIIGTLLVLTGSSDVALTQPARTQVECSMLDVAATTMIEDHGRVADVSPERLYGAALVMQEARKACRDERFNEARALYDLVLSLGPVVGQASEIKAGERGVKR